MSGATRNQEDPLICHEFETALLHHGSGVLRLLRAVLRDGDEARDAYQDTWFALWRGWGRITRVDDPWPYIRRAAMHKAWDRLRARDPGTSLERPEEVEARAGETPLTPVVDLERLPPEQRLCLTLFFWEGLSVRAIAARLEVPEGTVKTWMFRARARLREQLRDLEGGVS